MAKKADKPEEKTVRLDFDAVVTDMRGQPVKSGATERTLLRAMERFASEAPADQVERLQKILDEESVKPLTLGIAAQEALGGAYEEEKNMAMDQRNQRFVLGLKINPGGIIEITTDEREKIRALLPKRFLGSIVAPSAARLLDSPVEDEPAAEEAAIEEPPAAIEKAA